MNIHNHTLMALGLAVILAASGQSTLAAGKDQTKFKPISPQFIAALGDPGATAGTNAQSWGLWRQDPGPRGVRLDRYERLKAAGGVAPALWKFDSDGKNGSVPGRCVRVRSAHAKSATNI